MRLPDKPLSQQAIFKELSQLEQLDPHYKKAKLFSLVYYLGEAYTGFLSKVFYKFFSANGLNPGAFKSLKVMERNIVAMTADLFHGDDAVCGVVTSGGTESCLLAVKTYRDFARVTKRIKKPEMIVADTAHVAWLKGAQYFNVKIHRVHSLPEGGMDIDAVKKKINRNTILLLGSAPEYPHGLIDPINKLSALAVKYKIPLHVDACVGGFILPFIEENGHALPPWDFRVEGVTSISADIHKYGFAAKGASLILYRHQRHFEHQVFVDVDWPGGIFASPALLGTRPGGAYAAAYAALLANGRKGYLKLAKDALSATEQLKKGITELGFKILGNPQATLFAYRSSRPDIDVFAVADLMEKHGWFIDRIQKPDALHAMVTPGHLRIVKDYLRDLKACLIIAQKQPELSQKGQAATYGMMAHVPFRKIVKKQVLKMFASTYRISGGVLNLEDVSLENSVSDAGTPVKRPLAERFALWLAERNRKRNR
ncbi:MAG TPA: aspartate aminotransferase family protein [Turneriella sp.]|nr:aspartate aminotransferase family protein [Turneriella sp.]